MLTDLRCDGSNAPTFVARCSCYRTVACGLVQRISAAMYRMGNVKPHWARAQFWPLVAIFNYRYVPLKLRVLVINLAAFCWSTFLITRSNRKAVNLRK